MLKRGWGGGGGRQGKAAAAARWRGIGGMAIQWRSVCPRHRRDNVLLPRSLSPSKPPTQPNVDEPASQVHVDRDRERARVGIHPGWAGAITQDTANHGWESPHPLSLSPPLPGAFFLCPFSPLLRLLPLCLSVGRARYTISICRHITTMANEREREWVKGREGYRERRGRERERGIETDRERERETEGGRGGRMVYWDNRCGMMAWVANPVRPIQFPFPLSPPSLPSLPLVLALWPVGLAGQKYYKYLFCHHLLTFTGYLCPPRELPPPPQISVAYCLSPRLCL